MRKSIEYVKLVFENCNTLIIPNNDILTISVCGITRSVERYWKNSLSENLRASYFWMKLKMSVLDRKGSIYFDGDGDETRKHFFKYKDIVGIDIHYKDGTNEYVLLPWGENDEYTNSLMESKIIKKEKWEDEHIDISIEDKND